MKNILFLKKESNIFFSSLIFLQLIMLNICKITKILKTLVMCLEGPYNAFLY